MSHRFSNEKLNSRAKILDIMNPGGRIKPKRTTIDLNVTYKPTGKRTESNGSNNQNKHDSTESIKTGASLIPDLNIIIEHMRNMPDDRFIYLAYMLPKTSEYFTPYTLKEYTWENLPNRSLYFTMSRHGVTYWHLSENFFTPLLQWQQEFQQFLSIIKIRTFAMFRIWKGFKVWEKTIKWKKQNEARLFLQDHLFIAIPHLAQAILKLRSDIVFLERSNFINVSVIEEWHPFYFLEVQMKIYERLKETLRAFRERSKKILYDACLKAIIDRGFFPDDEINYYPSVKKMRDAMNFMDRAKKRNFCKILSNYCDHMMYHLFHQVTVNSFRDLVEAMKIHDNLGPTLETLQENLTLHEQLETNRPKNYPQSPFFVADFRLLPDRIEIEPSEDVMMHIFNRMITLILETVTEIENFTDDKIYFQFTEPSIMGRKEERLAGVAPDLSFLLRTDHEFQYNRKIIYNFIKLAYEKAKLYTLRFETIRTNYEVDTHTDPNIIKSERDLNKLRDYCERYCNNVKALDGILSTVNLGLLKLTQDSFKETVTPICIKLQNVLAAHLPKLAIDQIELIAENTRDLSGRILAEPQTTLEIVEHLRFLDVVDEEMIKLFKKVDYAHDVFIIIKDYAISIDDERKEDYMDCEDSVNRLNDKLKEIKSKRNKFIAQLEEYMNKDIQLIFEETHEIYLETQDPSLLDKNSTRQLVKSKLNSLLERLQHLREKAAEYISYQKEFKIDITMFTEMDQTFSEIRLRQNLHKSIEEWEEAYKHWTTVEFNKLVVNELVDLTIKTIKNCMQFEKYLPANNIVPDLKQSAEDFKLKLPVIGYLRNNNFKVRHWTNIEAILGRKLYQEENVYLSTYIEQNAFNEEIANSLMEISSQATGEAQLENMLKSIEAVWKEHDLTIVSYHNQKDVFTLAGTEELQTILDDSNVNINTIAASKYVGPIKNKVNEWIALLEQFGKTFEVWMDCQASWIYLEAIFASPDIQRQLPQEAKMFFVVDKSFKELLRTAKKISLALPVMSSKDNYDVLKENNHLLDLITRGLEAYLEVKRVVFPRFYFLSNGELLEILAQTRIPQAVQPHLQKCFDAIHHLEFGQKDDGTGRMIPTNDILAFNSPEGEKLFFLKGLKARGAVEEWLSKVEEGMFASVKRAMRFGYQCYPNKERDMWLQDHPNQVALTISQQQWASEIHAILDNPNNDENKIVELIKQFEMKCLKNLAALAALTRQNITSLVRKVLTALITIDVHAKDSVRMLIDKNVVKSTDFDWLKMLRFYWSTETDTVYSRMTSATIPYYYEYLGASGVLVLTPLTDRCYLCLMGAIQMNLGGAPAGPAGTGKTETTKDLAKSVAKQCVVFNCSDGLDYKMMGRFFSGLAQCGAWCCFDEFNRIDIEVLSVIAQQLITIRNAKVMNSKRFIFEGREIKLNKSCAVFITMNPGYAGRTELPDNLKALFRPISMMVPDYALIAEVILYSEGFEDPKNLAQKMVQMYKLCSEQLSQQNHYDFGMRAVKSVLVMAGALKRASPNQREDVTLITALKDSNIPKFLVDDAILFLGILSDLFPGVDLPDSSHMELEESIILGLTQKNLQPVAATLRKCIQLYETMCVRWGVMLVGPTGGGKSTVLHALEFALGNLFETGVDSPQFRPVVIQCMNPKAVSLNELYGYINPKTLEWQDGLLGLAVRSAVNVEDEIHQWIVNDGPVDAVWIENLNTVLDDNKMLCLANSERIKLSTWVHMVFEVQDLLQASPATVSRCGMVYVDPNDLGWLPLLDSWIVGPIAKRIQQIQLNYLYDLFIQNFQILLELARKHGRFYIDQVTSSKVSFCLELLSSLIEQINLDDSNEEDCKSLLNKMFIWSVLWSQASNFQDNEKFLFEKFLRGHMETKPYVSFPTEGSLWDYRINLTTHKWESWSTIVDKFIFHPEDKYFDMQVPTVDTTKYGYVMELLLQRKYPVMFTGDTGVGKTVLAVSTLKKLMRGSVVPVQINFSAQTTSIRTQEMIEGSLEKRKRNQLGAPIGKTVIIFIDDVNMPKLDTYGSQPAIELLRQFLDFRGFYDREKLFWKEIVDVVLSCACAPPGGGRNSLTPRFVRHFALLTLPKPNDDILVTIFNGILTGFLSEFSSVIRPLSTPIVNACVDVYMRISKEMLPTPDKSHYIFNLRDLSKCIQGILQASSLHYNMEMQILRLFYHETTRVFHDRLINDEDKETFKKIMEEVCLKHFNKHVYRDDEPPILYGDFMVFGKAKAERVYEEIKDHIKLKSILMDYVEDYNTMMGKNMNLILFQDALEHTVRLARLLRSDRGNGLLVGVAGMGKQSLTKLAAHINEYKCIQIELKRNYDINAFHEDLRNIYRQAGIDNTPIAFLLIDTQIVEEEFLEDINNLLNSGEVPNLFEGDDYEKLILDTREACNAAMKDGCSRDAIYKFFINRVRNNLHVVLSMSPVGNAFRRRCRMFPSLVNCTTIDWFSNWPTEALFSVALGLLATNTTTPEECEALATTTVYIHKTVEEASERFYKEMKRYYYTTPSSYLELLKLYQSLLKNKSEEIINKRKRISNGLNKILQTNDTINVMQKELEVMVPQLDEKSANMKLLLDRLAIDTRMADQVKESIIHDEANAKEKARMCQAMSDDANKDLEIAMPALREAEDALKGLTKADINELKSFATPPALVQFVMEAVCILLGAKPTWASAKGIMADVNFIKRLFEFDKEHIKEETLKKVKKYITHKDFVPAKFEKVSKVAKSVSLWVIAMDKFAKVYKVVEPKIRRKELAESELKEVMAILRSKQQELASVEAKIQALKDNIEQKSREFQIIQDSVDLTYGRINRAGRLTSALSDEEIRWKETVQSLTIELTCVPGDVLVAAACVAYLGAFSIDYRNELSAKWVIKCRDEKIPSNGEFHLLKVLGDPYQIRQWTIDGLPKDDISVENGLYATRALRWPLMIDPQEQANRWIRNMEKHNNLHILKMNDPSLLRTIENCIRQGYPILLEDISETIDPSIRPVLQRETYIYEGKTYLKLGDVIIDYDGRFKLYMTTKLANPHYLPEICINVTLVNFLVTESGLEDQLLSDIVAIELPALEIQRNDLIVKINTDKQQLLALEDKVLKLLFNSQGNILDDEELVETLNDAKETSLIIATRLVDTEETEKVITATREKYRNLASRGSILYFVIASLADIDPMYQYSLKYFSHIFCAVIKLDHPKMSTEERIAQLKLDVLKAIYDNVSRGLFENHKLIFSFLLSIAIEKQDNRVSQQEFNFITRGVVGSVKEKAKPSNIKISDFEWETCLYLDENFPAFKGFSDQMQISFFLQIDDNREVFHFGDTPNGDTPTDYWNLRLTDFHKLMFISIFRRERFLLNVNVYLKATIGQYFTEVSAEGSQLKVVFADTSSTMPLIFVLSSGSDPMANFLRFAEEMKYMDKLYSISLGQGQGPIAESLIDKSVRLGHWVFLQNCHLATSWMSRMENIVRNITLGITKTHTDFRLFLSSMPQKSFPISVLQNSVKVTNEPPKGIKANILGALADINVDYFEQHVLEEKWRAIVFGLCVFHAVLLERRKFGPLGWNIAYEFNESDRECGLKMLDFFINRTQVRKIPWTAIYYINGEITWGGRVTDFWDQRCLRTILKIFTFENILDPNYKYCRGNPYYCDPRKNTIREYKEYVQHFPTIEDPEIFGMNENANLVYRTKATNFFINTLLIGQPRSAADDEGQIQENDLCLDIITKIQEVLVQQISNESLHPTLLTIDAKGQQPSLTTVLVQEIDRYNNSLDLIHASLVKLRKAIKGLIVMSEELEEVFQSLLANLIPKLWEKKSFLSIKTLPSYIADFQRRIDFIQSWASFGNPKSFWISGFYFPQSFLTGILQTYARKRVLPIDELKIDFKVLDNVLIQQNFFERRLNNKSVDDLYENMIDSSEAAVNVHGIFVEAAEWKKSEGGLCDARLGVLYSRLPAICFIPCLKLNPGERYEAPLYKTQTRSGVLSTTGHSSNFILSIFLESNLPPDFWILKGTALVSAVAENIS